MPEALPPSPPDWTGSGRSTAESYREMARYGYGRHSPSYAQLAASLAQDTQLLDALDTLPPLQRQPNLLLGSVRFLGGPVDAWPAFRRFVLDRWDAVSASMRSRRTQTNEAARCTALLPVLAALPEPIALLEVGASAGLCLYPDRYAYRYATGDGLEHVVGDGPVELPCTVTGPAPLPTVRPDVRWRAGLDLHPLDVTDDEDVRWLESLIWPEQVERFARLRGAIAIAREDPPHIVAGDLTRDLPQLAAQAPADCTLVVYHSAVLAYLDPGARAAFAGTVAELARQRPLVWVSNEQPGIVEGTEHAHDGGRFALARDGGTVALAGSHGDTLDWLDT